MIENFGALRRGVGHEKGVFRFGKKDGLGEVLADPFRIMIKT